MPRTALPGGLPVSAASRQGMLRMSDDQNADIYSDLMETIQKAEKESSPVARARYVQQAQADYKDLLAHKEQYSEAQLKRVARRMQALQSRA